MPKELGEEQQERNSSAQPTPFASKVRLSSAWIVKEIKNGKSDKSASKVRSDLADLLLAGNVKPSKGVIVFGRLGANRKRLAFPLPAFCRRRKEGDGPFSRLAG